MLSSKPVARGRGQGLGPRSPHRLSRGIHFPVSTFLRNWWPALAYAAFIFALSSVPRPIFLADLDLNDKWKHFLLFAAFVPLVWRGAVGTMASPRAAALLTVLLVSAYGASDELHQWFVPGRSCDWRDWVADTLAAALVTAALLVRRRGYPVTDAEAGGRP
jgi:hypothetical protein